MRIDSVKEWISIRKKLKIEEQKSIGFVPTMGALHQGHLSLVKKSLEENDVTLVSIFVNPTQFNDPKDFSSYPQRLEQDMEMLRKLGCHYLLTPNNKEIYPDGYSYRVVEEQFSKILCGEHRLGHFDGVLTVVMKLLNIAGADHAYFGEKDYQQYLLIKKMADSFFHPTKIIMGETVRDEFTGLALSSRNLLLSDEGKKVAGKFNQILRSAESSIEARTLLEKNGFDVDYVEEIEEIPFRRFGAVRLEGIRLIDNVHLS